MILLLRISILVFVAAYFHGPGTGHKITVGGEFGHKMVSEVVQIGENVKKIVAIIDLTKK